MRWDAFAAHIVGARIVIVRWLARRIWRFQLRFATARQRHQRADENRANLCRFHGATLPQGGYENQSIAPTTACRDRDKTTT
jgi:hypothetical protein